MRSKLETQIYTNFGKLKRFTLIYFRAKYLKYFARKFVSICKLIGSDVDNINYSTYVWLRENKVSIVYRRKLESSAVDFTKRDTIIMRSTNVNRYSYCNVTSRRKNNSLTDIVIYVIINMIKVMFMYDLCHSYFIFIL